MKNLFHKLADEGKAITVLRSEYATNGRHFTASRVQMILWLRDLKAKFFEGESRSETTEEQGQR